MARLRPDPRNYERFVEQSSESVAELRATALPARCEWRSAAADRAAATFIRRPRPVPEPVEQVRRWSAVLRAREVEIRELRRLLATVVRPARRRARRHDARQLTLPLG